MLANHFCTISCYPQAGFVLVDFNFDVGIVGSTVARENSNMALLSHFHKRLNDL
jgi:hypothetical protein